MEFPAILLKLDQIINLEDVLQRLVTNANLDSRPDVEWPLDETLHKRWKYASNETLGVNEAISGNGDIFKYILVTAYVERARKTVKDDRTGRFLDRNDRINKVESEVLFFKHEETVYAAVFMNLTKYTQSKLNYIIKDLLVEEKWGTLTLLPLEYHITDSTYYWLLNKFLIQDKVIGNQTSMKIESFTGYSGVSSIDESQVMTGDGERISALLGTLAFIFGDDSLKSLKLHVSLNDDDNILFELSNKGNIRIFEYDGAFFGENQNEKILATLLVYNKIIPEILSTYKSERDKAEWNEDKKREFITSVGTTIIERVNRELLEQEQFIKNAQGEVAASTEDI